MDKEKTFFAENVAIVQSQDSSSLVPFTITAREFFYFMGDTSKTVQLGGLPIEAVAESPWTHLKSLFGAWVERGGEDKQLEELYRSRRIPSSMPDEDE